MSSPVTPGSDGGRPNPRTPGAARPINRANVGSALRQRRVRRRTELANASIRPGLAPDTASGAAVWIAAALAVMWVLVLVNAVLDHRLLSLGIRPRRADGLLGIVISPLLHANAGHLAANSISFAVLGWLILISGLRNFVLVTASVIVLAGGIDWLTGPANSEIVGASGLVFGWLGYVIARAVFGRKLTWIVTAVAVVAIFSSTFAGLLPRFDSHVYWAGHVAGFAVGVLMAALLHRRRQPTPSRWRRLRGPRSAGAAGPGGNGA